MSALPENLTRACQQASEPGSCECVKNNNPTCVIACLYILEGGDIEEVKKWTEGQLISELPVNQRNLLNRYNTDFLDYLQLEWDSGEFTNETLLIRAKKLWSIFIHPTTPLRICHYV